MSLKCGQTDLSIFHWEILVRLCWFSCITHLAGLTSIRHYLQANPWERNLRFILIFALLVLLLVALFPTGFAIGFEGRYDTLAIPAICFFDKQARASIFINHFKSNDGSSDEGVEYSTIRDTHAFQSMLVSMILLLTGFLVRLLKVFGSHQSRLIQRARRSISSTIQRLILKLTCPPLSRAPSDRKLDHFLHALWRNIIVRPTLAIFLCVRVIADLITSEIAEVRS